jgi:hypothetical protein
MINEKTVSDEKLDNLVNFMKPANSFGIVFEDEAMASPVDPEVLRTVAANFKGTINGESPEKYLAVRDEHDDMILPPGFGSNKDYLTYPIPAEAEPVVEKPGQETVRQSKPDSDEFTP